MLTPSDADTEWQGREIFAIDAQTILRSALGNDAPLVICSGIVERTPGSGLVYPLWFPQPKGRPVDPKGHWKADHGVLAELVSRVTEMRSRRWNADVRQLADWPEAWETLIHRAYPSWAIFYACESGWADLIAAGAAWINELAPDAEWEVTDAKEKYGSLSLFWHGDLPAQAEEVLDCMEHLSAHICEICGSPGEIRPGGWLQCRCEEHAK